MRVTLNTAYSMIGTNLNRLSSDMSDINNQISSGRQMSKLSDDPINLASALRYRSSITEIEQYSENIEIGSSILLSTETSLQQMKDFMIRAKTLAINALDPALTGPEHKAIASEVRNITEQVVILGNTQVNGKYIFGGLRTTGYTPEEPAPFIMDKGDGYWVNGSSFTPLSDGLSTTLPTMVPPLTDITSGDLLINGENVGDIDLTPAAVPPVNPQDGLGMQAAANIATAINSVTTSYSNAAATADLNNGIDSKYQFDLNGETINLTITNNSTANQVATQTMDAINLATAQTGVTASLNGDTVVFENADADNNANIDVTDFTVVQDGGATLGFSNFSKKIVTTSLTTLYATDPINADTVDGTDSIFNFELNDTTINVRIADGATAADAAKQTVDTINLLSTRTGVTAEVGTGSNGGAVNAIVFKNTTEGNDSAIRINNYNSVQGDVNPLLGGAADPNLLVPVNQAADATHNTGEIHFGVGNVLKITSPNHGDDTILTALGIGGGGIGFTDKQNDGELIYGYGFGANELEINGIEIPATTNDGISSQFATFSAAAKANAINSLTDQTGVVAKIDPASHIAQQKVAGGDESNRLNGKLSGNGILAGQLQINGSPISVDIPASGGAVNGLFMDSAISAQNAVNNELEETGIRANLTTLYADNANPVTADTVDYTNTIVEFELNGQPITITVQDGATATDVAKEVSDTINSFSEKTGVEVTSGTGNNGGALGEIVFQNIVKGDETAITVSNFNTVQGDASVGFADFSQIADSSHNTGEIALESDEKFTVSGLTDTLFSTLGDASTPDIGDVEFGATPQYLDSGDLIINGVDIFSSSTAVLDQDKSNSLVRAINSKSEESGVTASRTPTGAISLSVEDGRNIHVVTSDNGEAISNINGSAGEQVYFGSLQLSSTRAFMLEDTLGVQGNAFEPGLATLGLAGGETNTGELDDISSDGKIYVKTIRNKEGAIRYAGDRESTISIKVGKTSVLDIGENGQDAISDTSIFTALQSFEDALRSKSYTTVTGIHAATDTTATLNSKNTGLETEDLLPDEDLFEAGNLSFSVYDNSYYPPKESVFSIAVDPENDTLDDVTQRLNGIPYLSASWNADGKLELDVNDPERYTFSLGMSTSNFLEVAGVTQYQIQEQAFEQSMASFDDVIGSFAEQISALGARYNRIDTQNLIYDQLNINNQENLSEVQDTDMIQAIMDLKAKEVAYQAALATASKTMQLSLVDYL